MKNYKLQELIRDFDFIERALLNEKNQREHLIPLRILIDSFNSKYTDEIGKKHANVLYDTWNFIDEQIFLKSQK